jgi:hypothetical protein
VTAASASAQCDFIIDQAADWFVELYWTDYNNVPIPVVSPIRMEIRSSSGALVAELIYDGDLPDGSVPPSILFNAESGLIQLQLTSSQTDNMPPGVYNYDLFVTYQDAQNNPLLRRQRLLYGQVEVRGKVTQQV